MAPIISRLLPDATATALERGFPTLDGQHRPNTTPPEIPLDDAFVIIVSIGVVAGLTLFVLLQALQALKYALRVRAERQLGYSAYGTITLSPSFARNPYKHSDMGYSEVNLVHASPARRPLLANLQPLNYQSRDSTRTDSDATATNANSGRRTQWNLPHRCQFTLSPEEYDSDSSASTMSFTAARRDASFDRRRRRVSPGYFNLDLRRTPQIEEADEDEDEDDEEEESEHSSGSSCFLSDATAINSTSVNTLSLAKVDLSTKTGKGATDYFSYKPKPNTVNPLTAVNANTNNNNPVGMKEKIGKICVVYDDTAEGRECAKKAQEEAERGPDAWKYTPRRHARRRDAIPVAPLAANTGLSSTFGEGMRTPPIIEAHA